MSTKKVSPIRGKHSRTMLTDHLVFTPKYREAVLTPGVAATVERSLREAASELGVEIMDMAVNADHVHMFIQHPPSLSASDIARRLKGASSRRVRQAHPELVEWCGKGLWAPSCFHGSVGHGVDVVSAYIHGQEGHHAGGRE